MVSAGLTVCLGICVLGVALGELCPGGQWTCATGMTCCTLPSGGEGCCPFTNATCCPDHVHCCPMGTTCSTKGGGSCQDNLGISVAEPSILESSVSAHSSVSNAVTILSNEICIDGTQCPDDSTCCFIKGRRFGCCPFPAGVCCSDQVHCCPEGTVCHTEGFCFIEQAVLTDAKRNGSSSFSNTCRGGEFKCLDGTTCCRIGKDVWGCCPMPNAVCCANQEHCCPKGYHCVDSGSSCAPDE